MDAVFPMKTSRRCSGGCPSWTGRDAYRCSCRAGKRHARPCRQGVALQQVLPLARVRLHHADAPWKSFRLSRSSGGADTTEAGQDDLWEVIENFVVGQAVDAAANRHNGEQRDRRVDDDNELDANGIDVTMCHVANGWLTH